MRRGFRVAGSSRAIFARNGLNLACCRGAGDGCGCGCGRARLLWPRLFGWALLELGSMHARASNVVLRVDASGHIEWNEGLAGLNDFSVSPNGEYLAGTFWQGETRSLKVFRIRDY